MSVSPSYRKNHEEPMKNYEQIIVSTQGKVATIQMNRPKALNALCNSMMDEVTDALEKLDRDESIHVIILTGSDKAFAAGADLKELGPKNFTQLYMENFAVGNWDSIGRCRKPVIAAVAGFALGGGCEVAMLCDMIIAGDNAKFGQPEITVGVMPGGGGTQRLTRLVGKARAMELCLTGRMIEAEEALRIGLISRIVPAASLMDETMKTAQKIASYSLPAAMMIKESINQSLETGLSEGLRFERRFFYAAFSTEDQKEGMSAFAEKRAANFKNR